MQMTLHVVPAADLLPGDIIGVRLLAGLPPVNREVINAIPRKSSTYGLVDVTIKLNHPASAAGTYTFPVADHETFTVTR